MGCTRPLWDVLGHYGMFLAIMGCTRPLWDVLGHYKSAIMGYSSSVI